MHMWSYAGNMCGAMLATCVELCWQHVQPQHHNVAAAILSFDPTNRAPICQNKVSHKKYKVFFVGLLFFHFMISLVPRLSNVQAGGGEGEPGISRRIECAPIPNTCCSVTTKRRSTDK